MISSRIYTHLILAITIIKYALISQAIAGETSRHSPALSGFIGLNTIPNARMDEIGTTRLAISTLDPYMHGYIGIQIAKPLYINIRQNALISSLTKDAKSLYPSIDTKFRLLKESKYRPEISIGFQSIIGHKKMAGEYISLSKSYKNFDLTAGIGWGAMGSSSKFNNPLKYINTHFDKNRNPDSPYSNNPSNWFTGESIGFFGGIEYFTKFKNLSLKLDYGNINYINSQITNDYKQPRPWSAGISYKYNNWLHANIGTQGMDKIFANISVSSNLKNWRINNSKYKKPKPFYKIRNKKYTNKGAIKSDAISDNIEIYDITEKDNKIFAKLHLNPNHPSPQQIGRAARYIAMHSAKNIEEINIRPINTNLYNADIKIIRTDVENSVNNKNISPQEIWENTDFAVSDNKNKQINNNLSTKWINNKKYISLILENQLSLSEKDSGILYRSSAIIENKSQYLNGIILGNSLRINLKDNLDEIEKIRPIALYPIKSDINKFTNNRINIERSYIGYTKTIAPNIHSAIMAGYLDEFYAGLSANILYRPFDKRLAFGGQIYSSMRRNPNSFLSLALQSEAKISANINMWYDIPRQEITLNTKIGRFLAGDNGISISVNKIFKNGIEIDAQTSISNYSDPDLFGGTTSSYHNIAIKIPLGYIPKTNIYTKTITKISPLGRDIAQTINPPINLFDIAEKLTIDHMADHWLEIMN